MASRDSFFGATIPNRGDAAPEDDANDTTFGDIGDIRAGDAASEQQWASQHDQFAKAIEAEREQILGRKREQDPLRNPSVDSPAQTQPAFAGLAQRGQGASPPIQPQQSMHRGHPGMSPGRPMHPDYTRALLMQQQQQRQPGNVSDLQQQALLEENRMRLLQQQQMRIHHQMSQQQSQRGQQQQQPQMSAQSPEMQMFIQARQRQEMERARQRQEMEHMLRMRQQQAQAQPPPPPTPEMQQFFMAQQRLMQENQHLDPVRLRFLLQQQHQQFLAASTARARSAATPGPTAPPQTAPSSGMSLPPGFTRPPPPAASSRSTPGQPPAPGATKPAQTPPARSMPRDAMTLEDLEQTLRSTTVSEKPRRRIESMTDKDLEWVLRVHLRQIDSAIPYRDDYYWAIYDDERSTRDMYGDLGVHLRKVEAQSGEESAMIKKRLRKKDRDGNLSKKAPGVHTSSNLKTLTRALGTIQSSHPRAPRRLMDLGTGDGKTAVPAVHKAIEEEGKNRLLKDDERIAVRAAVEDGYDLLSRLHDIARKKSAESYDALLGSLLDTLHLAGPEGIATPGDLPFESTRFFVRMCIFEKGRRYIARLLSVLSPMDAARVITGIFENLSVLLYTIAPRAQGDAPDEFWEAVLLAVRNPLIPTDRCGEMLDMFCRIHAEDAGALIIVLSSAVGAQLLYAIMSRVFAVKKDGEVSHTSNNPHWEMFCRALAPRLGDVFDAAESNKNVWEVAAMLDALAEGPTQLELRRVLRGLLDSGRAPPPPAT